MVGICCPRISRRCGHRRTRRAMDLREQITRSVQGGNSVPANGGHGIDVAVEFKPVECATEPLIHEQPIVCPLPEPSILNDGSIWKERVSSSTARARAELPVVAEGSHFRSRDGNRYQPFQPKEQISSSYSAPEHKIVALIEECNTPETMQ